MPLTLQPFCVLLRIIGRGVGRDSPPNQVLRIGGEHIDDQSPDFVDVNCRGCFSKASETSPTPSASKTVIKRVHRVLRMGFPERVDQNIASRGNLGPAFRGKRAVDSAFGALVPNGIPSFQLAPGICFEVDKVYVVIVVRGDGSPSSRGDQEGNR